MRVRSSGGLILTLAMAALLALPALANAAPQTNPADSIVGVWKTSYGDTFHISQVNGTYQATVDLGNSGHTASVAITYVHGQLHLIYTTGADTGMDVRGHLAAQNTLAGGYYSIVFPHRRTGPFHWTASRNAQPGPLNGTWKTSYGDVFNITQVGNHLSATVTLGGSGVIEKAQISYASGELHMTYITGKDTSKDVTGRFVSRNGLAGVYYNIIAPHRRFGPFKWTGIRKSHGAGVP